MESLLKVNARNIEFRVGMPLTRLLAWYLLATSRCGRQRQVEPTSGELKTRIPLMRAHEKQLELTPENGNALFRAGWTQAVLGRGSHRTYLITAVIHWLTPLWCTRRLQAGLTAGSRAAECAGTGVGTFKVQLTPAHARAWALSMCTSAQPDPTTKTFQQAAELVHPPIAKHRTRRIDISPIFPDPDI